MTQWGSSGDPATLGQSQAENGAKAALGRWDEAWEALVRVETWEHKVNGGQVPNRQGLLDSHWWNCTQSFCSGKDKSKISQV